MHDYFFNNRYNIRKILSSKFLYTCFEQKKIGVKPTMYWPTLKRCQRSAIMNCRGMPMCEFQGQTHMLTAVSRVPTIIEIFTPDIAQGDLERLYHICTQGQHQQYGTMHCIMPSPEFQGPANIAFRCVTVMVQIFAPTIVQGEFETLYHVYI